MYLLQDFHGLPIGQIRFQLSEYQSNPVLNISFSLDKCVRGLGLSHKLLYLGIKSLVSDRGTDIPLLARVKNYNNVSARVFESFGFTECPSSDPSLRLFLYKFDSIAS